MSGENEKEEQLQLCTPAAALPAREIFGLGGSNENNKNVQFVWSQNNKQAKQF